MNYNIKNFERISKKTMVEVGLDIIYEVQLKKG
jgi:hypothetical protein